MKKYCLTLIFVSAFMFNLISGARLWGGEPSMADYTCYPIFQVNAVQPNILIMLDNSGSMNFLAYGTWPGDGAIVRDQPYAGAPYNGRTGMLVKASANDAQEASSVVTLKDASLTLGMSSTTSVKTGLRFTNINIPRGKTISEAYIQFKASYNDTSAASLTIVGEAADSSTAFSTTTADISTRVPTTASVAWSSTSTPALASWTAGTNYNTPNIASIVQEIVNRSEWTSGNAMSFRITGTGTRRAYSYDGSTAYAPMLYIKYSDGESMRYYGYFNPDYFYYWDGSKFNHKYKKVEYVGDPTTTSGYWSATTLTGTSVSLYDTTIVSEGLWDGNWMNWASMRRIDVLRKVLMGGLQTARAGGGNQVNYGETPAQSSRIYIRLFNSSLGSAVSPYDGSYYYGMSGGSIYVDVDTNPWSGYLTKKSLSIQKTIAYDPDDFDSVTKNLAGILDRVGVKARWGNEWFNNGTGNNGSGGSIEHTIQEISSTSLITDLQNTGADTSTPLAEAYYVAVQYYKQEDPESGLEYPNGAVPNDNLGDDPYYNGSQFVECAKSFVLLLTDGASTVDAMVPSFLRDWDVDGKENYTTTTCTEAYGTTCDYADGGTDYLDDIALYARTTDLRSDLDGEQNLILYSVLAFEDDINAVNLLSDASKNGGFIDKNGNNRPDLQAEWDANSDNVPDTFYMASDGYKLQTELLKAINDILKRAASGTAVSVLATSGEGEGTLVQAYFKPMVPSGLEEVNWVGYLQTLWVDAYGNLREDTVSDDVLDITEDNIVASFLDTSSGDTRVKVWHVSGDEPYPDTSSAAPDEIKELDQITPIWEGAKMLATRSEDERKIFTYIDQDQDNIVDESTNDPFDATGEIVKFHTDAASLIKPYLGVKTTDWTYLGATHDNRVSNLINYIRGRDITGLRTRTIGGQVWKLGDIVHSTPVSVSKPPDNYHIIYGDQSYAQYYDTYKNRETIVYVGGNDGMLHAFTGGVYKDSTKSFIKKGTDTSETSDDTTENIGDEIWAYVPQVLLPHLKWLANPVYTHVYYVDLKPKIFDAKIDSDGDGDKEWRTLLLLGLNLGGKAITATGDFDYNSTTGDTTRTFYSSYTCMDVTDPRSPRILWERSYDDLELTSSFPAVIKVKDKWFAVFGSGPSDCDCSSSKYGHIFVVDLDTGNPYQSSTGIDWLFQTAENKAFMNSPVSVDKDLNYNVDAIYFGESYLSSLWQGKLYKVAVPWVNSSGAYDGLNTANYSDNPLDTDTNKRWKLVPLFNATRPITSSVALSIDNYDNMWVYVGSGRYLSEADKTNTDQQYMFGVKDPFFNKNYQTSPTDYYHNYTKYKELLFSDLFFSDPYIIKVGGEVLEDTSSPLDGVPDANFGGWTDLLAAARLKDGWYRSLTITGERIITRFSILGGIVFTPSFVPTADVCGFGGDSYLYGQFYETGTAYYKSVFKEGEKDITYEGEIITTILDKTSIGAGMASSIGIHVGKEGSKGFIQTSTGTIIEESLDTAFTVKSGLKSWIEK